jgi:cyclomaltodextrinase / maltogenic alpha-amylase / neopullulanase
VSETAQASSSWAAQSIWWQVYPLGFTGAPTGRAPGGRAVTAPASPRLRQLEAWLDYAADLGCSGLLLGPIFAAHTHGYDTTDHFRVDPRLGDEADFTRLAAAARERGLAIVLDGVFNHVGRGFAMFARALAEGPDSAAARWFRPRPESDGSVSYDTFEGHDGLVALNHDEPAVAAHVTAVMNHWLDRGASGWRLDAAYAVAPSFWRAVLPAARARHPRAWFAAEMIHGDYARYVTASGIDSVTQYELWKAIWSSLNDRNFFELAWALDRHNGFLDVFTPLTFVGNHDVTRIASRLSDHRHLGHALAVLFSVGGTPAVYYGDEQGLPGAKEERVGGDDAIRPAYPADPGRLPAQGWPVYRLHQRLIALRRRHPWLAAARTTVVHLTNRAAALQTAALQTAALQTAADPGGDGGHGNGDDGTRIMTLLNTDDRPHEFPLDLSGLVMTETLEPAGPETAAPGRAAAGDPFTVPAHAWRIIVARASGPLPRPPPHSPRPPGD